MLSHYQETFKHYFKVSYVVQILRVAFSLYKMWLEAALQCSVVHGDLSALSLNTIFCLPAALGDFWYMGLQHAMLVIRDDIMDRLLGSVTWTTAVVSHPRATKGWIVWSRLGYLQNAVIKL